MFYGLRTLGLAAKQAQKAAHGEHKAAPAKGTSDHSDLGSDDEGKQELQSEDVSTASSNEEDNSQSSEDSERFEKKIKTAEVPAAKKAKVLAASVPEPQVISKGFDTGITGIGTVKSKTFCFKCPDLIDKNTLWFSYRWKVSHTLKHVSRCHVL